MTQLIQTNPTHILHDWVEPDSLCDKNYLSYRNFHTHRTIESCLKSVSNKTN